MDNLNSETKTNVVSLFSARKPVEKKMETEIETESEEKSEEVLFAEAMQRNEDNRKRMMQERLKANKGVLKSYRIKH